MTEVRSFLYEKPIPIVGTTDTAPGIQDALEGVLYVLPFGLPSDFPPEQLRDYILNYYTRD
jgi:hypothetical protein